MPANIRPPGLSPTATTRAIWATRALPALLVPLVLLVLWAAPARPAFAQDCVRITCAQGSEHCAVAPSRLSARMPAGFAVTSINGNTAVATQGDAGTARCAPVQRLPREVSLDQASLYGSVQVAGRLRVPGILRFEPNDGGTLEFRPARQAFQGTGRFYRAHFQRIRLDTAQPAVAIAPPRALANANCWQARATADLSDFSVLIGDTSAAGTDPRQARITAVHGFTACTWGGP